MLLRDLGTAYRGEALSYKPYPCGRPLHAAIDAALAARAQLQITRRDDLAAVTIEADPAGYSDQFAAARPKAARIAGGSADLKSHPAAIRNAVN